MRETPENPKAVPFPIDSYAQSFAALKARAPSLDDENWTEADTRSKLIDTLLIDCLGWLENDICRELAKDKLRLDYRLSLSRPTVVIEAKRMKIPLKPQYREGNHRLKLRTFEKAYPDVWASISQVATYCHEFAVRYAILTNGRTYILFQATRVDGINWKEGNTLIVGDIFSATTSLTTIYDLFSRAAFEGEAARGALNPDEAPMLSKSIIATYEVPDALQPFNPLSEHLERSLQQVFSDQLHEDSDDIVKHCYVYVADTPLRDSSIEYPLIDRPDQNNLKVVTVSSLHAFKQFEKSIEARLTAQSHGSTLLVIGNIGVGKTLFIRRFFNPECNTQHLPKNVVPFIIDYRKSTLSPNEILEDAYRRLRQNLETMDSAAHGDILCGEKQHKFDFSSQECMASMFRADINRFERLTSFKRTDPDANARYAAEIQRLAADNQRFVSAALMRLRDDFQKVPCIVLDNADHHSREFQKNVYLAAKTLELELKCLVLLSLQETWYWVFRESDGPLAHYQDVVFHIPAPRMKDVLAKRIDFAIDNSSTLISSIVIPLGNHIVLEPQRLCDYLRKCKDAFFKADAISVFYESLANGNVRRGLDLFARFIRSGHTDAAGYLKATASRMDFSFSLDDVIGAIAKSEYKWYSSSRSDIPNLFTLCRTSADTEYSRFLACYLLQYLSGLVAKVKHNMFGYAAKSRLLELCQQLGSSEREGKHTVEALAKLQLCRVAPDSIASGKDRLRISALGNYMINRMIIQKGYLACVMLDTPITNTAVFEKICAEYKEYLAVMSERRDKCIVEFVQELKAHEQLEFARVKGTELEKFVQPVIPKIEQAIAPSMMLPFQGQQT